MFVVCGSLFVALNHHVDPGRRAGALALGFAI
jgi:hypothetical protein